MPLSQLRRPPCDRDIPRDVRSFLGEADRRIRRFQRRRHVPAFIPSDYEAAYGILSHLAATARAPGMLFCEWGSGLGVIACLAALLDFDAVGIEVDGELVDAARRLAADFELPVEFVEGSFIPRTATRLTQTTGPFAWLTTTEAPALCDLGLAIEDFGVIFAYPWPDEESLVGDLFERYARCGAILVSYHGGDDFRLRQKIKANRKR
jgi:hypothetical protein